MTDTSDEFTWRDYEDYIFEKLSDWAGPDAEVLFNEQRIGRFSQTPRQIDVLVTGRFAGITAREITAAVDCKYYTRTIDVRQVDEFIGYVNDVATDLGLLVTNKGFTPAALQRAKVPGIELQVIVAGVDDLPPPERYNLGWDDAYYESEYWTIEGGGKVLQHGALIRYSCLDPESLQYSFDPDNPPERLDEVILSGTEEEVSWGDDEARASASGLFCAIAMAGPSPMPQTSRRSCLNLPTTGPTVIHGSCPRGSSGPGGSSHFRSGPQQRRDSFATVPIVAPDRVAVTAGDHRTVCSPQPAAADRRPRIRGVAPPRRTNLATPATPISLCCFSRLRKSCPTTTADSATVGRVCESYDRRVSTEAREVAAGGFLMDAGRGT